MNVNPSDIALSPDQKAFVARRAEATGRPWEELLAELLPVPKSESNGRQESAYDVATRLGLIAMSCEGPADLASNPKYMAGFGDDSRTCAD